MLPFTPGRILFYGLTPGLEPCSPHSPCGTLPNKLKPTNIIEDRFELSPSVSNTDMLYRYTTQQSMAVRTGVEPVSTDRSRRCGISPYTNEPGNLYWI